MGFLARSGSQFLLGVLIAIGVDLLLSSEASANKGRNEPGCPPSSCALNMEGLDMGKSVNATFLLNRAESVPDSTDDANESEGADDEDDELDEESEEEEEEDYFDIHINIWGKPQVLLPSLYDQVMPVVTASEKYMNDNILVNQVYDLEQRYACRNLNGYCSQWASEGECEKNSDYMISNCSPACHTCDLYFSDYYPFEEPDPEFLSYDQPDPVTESGMIQPIPWGIPQDLGTTVAERVQEVLQKTYEYMTETVYARTEYEDVYSECENRHASCSYWAAIGECDATEAFMHLVCAPACHTCDQLDFWTRCSFDEETMPHSFSATGELNAMFQRIVDDPLWAEQYGPVNVLSSPATTDGPWILTLDHFLSDEECDRFIEIGMDEGFEQSLDIGEEESYDGSFGSIESEYRTSTNAWCPDSCQTDPIVGPVHDRIELLTGAHYNHSEWYQLLRYEQGQFYGEHHDYIQHEWERPQGPRVLTIFLYLNEVEEGGGTHFGQLGLTVQPKKGRALIWPSVLDEDLLEWDERTHHEALPVLSGLKYGANAWIHLRDFKTYYHRNCV